MKTNGCIYVFEPFRLDAGEHLLLRDGRVLPLTPKAFEILLALVENSSHTVSKDELMRRVWPDTCVEEVNLANNISLLRKVLGDVAGDGRYIQTVPRRGYRFVASVGELRPADGNAEIEVSGCPPMVDPMQGSQEPTGHGLENSPEKAVNWWAKAFRKRRPAIAVILLAIAVTALYVLKVNGRKPSDKNAPTPIKAIAVLPIRPVSAGSHDEMLEMGMTDALITRLSGIRGLAVRPLSAVLKYTDPQQDAVVAGHEQKVDAVVDGTIQRADNKIRITIQLWRTRDGASIWAARFDEKLKDLFTVQDAIAERCVDALALQLTGEEKKQLTKHYTENQDAWQLYIQGRIFWNKRNGEGMKKALKCFQAAIDLDPNYAAAYAGLADTYWFSGLYGLPPEVADEKQEAAAAMALALDPALAEAHAAMAVFKWDREGDFCEGEKEFKRSLELNPNYATAHHWYANFLSTFGRCDEGLDEIKIAQELDPQSLIINATVGLHLCRCGRIDEAIDQLRRTLEMDSNFMTAHEFLGGAYLRKGMYEEALAELRRGPVRDDESPGIACVYAAMGRRAEALKVFRRLKKNPDLSPDDEASIYVALGDNNHAIVCLERLLKENAGSECPGKWPLVLRADPRLEKLHSDPRFEELVRRYE